MDDKPSMKWARLHHMTHFKFWRPIHISGMVKVRAVKLCTLGDYIKPCQRDDKLSLKRVWLWSWSCDPFKF